METSELLEKLEERGSALPATQTKYDPDAEIEMMVRWVQSLEPGLRRQLLDGLREWVEAERLDEWRARAALLLSTSFADGNGIDAAVARLRRDHDDALTNLELDVIDAVSRSPTRAGLAYLRDLTGRLSTAESYRERRAAIRAAMTLCFLGEGPHSACLEAGMSQLRAWSDPALTRSAVSLLHALFAVRRGDTEILQRVLTPTEWRMVSE